MKIKITFYFLFFLTANSPAETGSAAISGIVLDKVSLKPVDSATVTLVNIQKPSERYSVISSSTGNWSFVINSAASRNSEPIPVSLQVHQNYPNPFNPSTRIRFSTSRPGSVRIAVYNILGQLLDEKQNYLSAGGHEFFWSSKGSAGTLFYSIETGGERIVNKMIQLDGGSGTGIGSVTTFQQTLNVSSFSKQLSEDYYLITQKFIYETDTVRILLSDTSPKKIILETIHNRALLIDLHNDMLEPMLTGYQIGIRNTINQTDLSRLREGGVDAGFASVWTNGNANPYSRCIAIIDTFKAQMNRYSSQTGQARTISEINSLRTAGKFAGILALEGGHSIENDLAKLKKFYELGIRYITITWNNSTSWAVSASDTRTSTVGLDDFGRSAIRLMDSLGIIIDVSHVGIKTVSDILATTKNPIIASHSGARTLRNHYRNLTDTQIQAIAFGDGVIGVVFFKDFLTSTNTATVDTVIKHIDYIKNLVGIDYVALGSDYDGGITTPTGMEDVSKFPVLTAALLRRGYSAADVRKILGENMMRVFKKVCGDN